MENGTEREIECKVKTERPIERLLSIVRKRDGGNLILDHNNNKRDGKG